MNWYLSAFEFLSRWAAQSGIVLTVAAIAVACFRQPAKKLLLIQASFVVCLVLPCLALVHLPQNWSWRWPNLGARSMASRPASGTRHDADNAMAADAGHAPSLSEHPRSEINDGFSKPVKNSAPATEIPPLAARRPAWPDARLACVIGYLAGVALMAAWWLMGWIGLARVLRRSRPADARCQAVLQNIAGQRARGVRLRISSLAGQPFMFGWRRPVIVLPERLASGEVEALRWSLAHESSHASRGDAWWWSLAGVVRLALFYQPLVWWLRAQMRLAQDYLADADAAGHARAPEDYAQFLTAWAASRGPRPVYGGLGILGRKSELYRRVAMLVQNPSLDRRCSRIWSGAALIALATVAGTIATYSNAADEPETNADRPEKLRIDENDKQAAAGKPAAAPAERARLKALLDGVLKRARAIHSGQFQLFENKGLQFSNALKQPVIINLRGDDVSVNRWSQKIHAVRRGGRVMVLDNKGSQPVWEGSQPVRPAELRIYYPSYTIPGETLPRCAGTLPTPAALRFVEKHRDEGRIEGHISGQELEDRTSTRLAWSVSEAEAASLFAGASELLAGGGTLRISVAEQLGYVLPLVEYFDRFGGVQARFEASDFFEATAGLFFPEAYHVAQREEITYRFERKIERLNEKLPDENLLIAIPAGTHVTDVRFRRDVKIDAKGHTFWSSPSKGFTIGTASAGLSKDLLAEMDRQVLSADEVEQAKQAAKRAQLPDAAVAKAPAAAAHEGNAELRYAGRSFDDWRDQLLNDLDQKTCMAAMEPIVSFGKKGYGEEAVAALAQTLHDDRDSVVDQAAGALAQIGPAAVPALMEGLTDPRPQVRRSSANALGSMGGSAKTATKELLKLLNDQSDTVRYAAIVNLIAVAGYNNDLRPALERIAGSGTMSDKNSLVFGLQRNPPQNGWPLQLLLQLSEDEHVWIRAQAGHVLAGAAPPEEDVVRTLKELIRDLDQQVWQNTLSALTNDNGHNTATRAIVLADMLASPELYKRLRSNMAVEQIYAILGSALEQAAITVPVLIDIADGQIDYGVSEVNSAIEALGKLGPAAKAAIPALERVISEAEGATTALKERKHYDDFTPKFARRALRKIRGADKEPPQDNN